MTMGRTSLRGHASRAVLALAVVLCAGGIAASVAQAAAPLTWAPPIRSDFFGRAFTALTCHSVSLCAAVDDGGNVFSSTAPLSDTWSATVSIDALPRLTAISCPSAGLCFAVDDFGRVDFGTAAAGTSAWTLANIDLFARWTGISCPSVSLCVAADSAGDLLATSDPRDSITWSLPMPVDGPSKVTAVSCPTTVLCAAVDSAGNVLVSTDPTNMQSWQATSLTRTSALAAVSCNSAALCVTVASDGIVYATANAASPPVTWSATPIDQTPLTAVSCTEVGLCVMLDRSGKVFESDNPAAGPPTWRPAKLDAGSELTGVSCLAAGFCVAVDNHGDTIAATLPAPAVVTGAGRAASQTVVSLAATVNANDAAISDCHFDYGPTAAYGASALCRVVPTATGGTQAVGAQLSRLTASTTYHFRIVASSGVATSAGGDAVFTTQPLLKAHPSIGGTPAVGSELSCEANVTTTAAETVAYAWLSDTVPIAGATAASYVVAPADQTHHLSCAVSISGDGGNATATSGFDAVPSETAGRIIETVVGTVRHRATSVTVPVTCSPEAAGSCTITLLLTATRTVHHNSEPVTVGSSTTTLAAGTTHTLSLSLNKKGKRLLEKRHRLATTLTISGTVIGTLTAILRDEHLVLCTNVRTS
jgi:hypothetical protein